MEQIKKIEKSKEEKKTAFVVFFSAATMVLEIFFGLFSNSMALLADGIHMGSHVLAIGLSWGAYILVRHLQKKKNNATDSEKVLSLSAYTSGILLLVFALFIVVEAIERFFTPIVEIKYMEAMVVAVIGIVVNIICAFILHEKHGEGDYNSHSAYLHVLADALTSLGAILGLICAMIWNIIWIDTVVALVCSLVIIRWAKRLLTDTGKALTIKQNS
ncbi:cation diffusion facilitator family transporter [Bacteroides thetaiotaomicron]|jgi:cation diffusion facilitator family transporter|uniref:cation diffusion facilitator family transporter n=1 Tax=Bacteroides thetaiotaomicron TaxID=818 RepID=UPI00232DC1FA|nr:cation diffusion facilitator family transporter [Bacteroides thetaiotaomicron]MDC2013059.1 cation diffusion facilitator family transporter [Bacteroides thetaiotaomicron]MDC2017597.1 cation diffusion facilitator family transporter [Bacteroides thetaiotaomicron]MDC2035555.1 cation diffusion facilitator family transporter [Bacteroides thetaiotaomicron]MDC2039860.1 cation diffusion facilitator family transporter [Bacteroides thetaiotaomicron]MDC2044508.1 cation diffusion facilitator family tran